MKRLLAVLMMSMSLGVAQVGYTQSLYTEENFHTHEETDAEINAIPPVIIPILVWIFRGVSYWALSKVLDTAWDELNEWLDDWGDHPYPDLSDSRLINVCKFYYDYSNNPNLTDGQQQMLDELKFALNREGEDEYGNEGGNYCEDLP